MSLRGVAQRLEAVQVEARGAEERWNAAKDPASVPWSRTDASLSNTPRSTHNSSSYPNLLDLSNELLLLIAEELYRKTHRRDLKRLRLASRRLRGVVTPISSTAS